MPVHLDLDKKLKWREEEHSDDGKITKKLAGLPKPKIKPNRARVKVWLRKGIQHLQREKKYTFSAGSTWI